MKLFLKMEVGFPCDHDMEATLPVICDFWMRVIRPPRSRPSFVGGLPMTTTCLSLPLSTRSCPRGGSWNTCF